MEKITNTTQLNEAIRLLEIKQKQEELILKEQFKITYDSLKPSSLIKNTIKNIIATPDLKTDVLSTVLSMATGYVSRKIVIGNSDNPIKNLLGSLLQMAITSLVSNKAEGIVSGIANFIKNTSHIKNEKD